MLSVSHAYVGTARESLELSFVQWICRLLSQHSHILEVSSDF